MTRWGCPACGQLFGARLYAGCSRCGTQLVEEEQMPKTTVHSGSSNGPDPDPAAEAEATPGAGEPEPSPADTSAPVRKRAAKKAG